MSIIRWEPFASSDEFFNRVMPSVFGRWPKANGVDAE